MIRYFSKELFDRCLNICQNCALTSRRMTLQQPIYQFLVDLSKPIKVVFLFARRVKGPKPDLVAIHSLVQVASE